MVTLRPEVTEHGAKGIPSRAQGLADSLCVEVRKAAEPACMGQGCKGWEQRGYVSLRVCAHVFRLMRFTWGGEMISSSGHHSLLWYLWKAAFDGDVLILLLFLMVDIPISIPIPSGDSSA